MTSKLAVQNSKSEVSSTSNSSFFYPKIYEWCVAQCANNGKTVQVVVQLPHKGG